MKRILLSVTLIIVSLTSAMAGAVCAAKERPSIQKYTHTIEVKACKKGQACGSSCISWNDVCHQ
ncbi:hypothetical protein FGG78_23670 [Thioclava sp. BHET1]|nr:hypothetical protein FGG78_23670 [Thioclava sp. BHET1]